MTKQLKLYQQHLFHGDSFIMVYYGAISCTRINKNNVFLRKTTRLYADETSASLLTV